MIPKSMYALAMFEHRDLFQGDLRVRMMNASATPPPPPRDRYRHPSGCRVEWIELARQVNRILWQNRINHFVDYPGVGIIPVTAGI